MKKAELKLRRELRKSGLKGKKLEEALKYGPQPKAEAPLLPVKPKVQARAKK